MRIIHLIFLIILFLFIAAISQPSDVFHSGEVLTYKVTWSFVRLGTIIITANIDTNHTDSQHFKLTMLVKSNPYLPFINIDEINETIVPLITVHFCNQLLIWIISNTG